MPRAPQRLTDRKREAIVRAAVEEFRAAGYEATSMDRIAEAAGVSKRTVYNHFPSKEALFSMILEELWERSVASDALPYRADQPLQAQLLQLLGQKLELLSDANFIDLARVAMAEIIHSPERAQAIVCRMGEKEAARVRGSARQSLMAGCARSIRTCWPPAARAGEELCVLAPGDDGAGAVERRGACTRGRIGGGDVPGFYAV